jgi:Dyp-type peroxidase family
MPIQLDQLPCPLELESRDVFARIAPILDWTQGFILEKHRRDYVANCLVRFDASAYGRVRQSLASLPIGLSIPSVSRLLSEGVMIRTSIEGGQVPAALPPIVFVGLSSKGMSKLGLGLDNCSVAFRQGFKQRMTSSPGRGDTSAWQEHWSSSSIDALIVIAAGSEADLEQAVAAIRAHWQGVADIDVEAGAVKRLASANGIEKGLAIEHFGFADGTSQPEFFVGKNTRTAGWRSAYDPAMPLKNVIVPEILPVGAGDRFGSYMAYLKIEQHLDRFEDAVDRLSTSVCPVSRARAGELITGRSREGKQLIDPYRHENDFSAEDDPQGKLWPFASHTRKMNPRTGAELGTRILRRGVPYEEGSEKGLLFQSFQASLQDQFEELFFNWGDKPNQPEDGTGTDPLIGRPLGTPLKFPSTCPTGIQIANLTTLRGGEYFYFPSITALKLLCLSKEA